MIRLAALPAAVGHDQQGAIAFAADAKILALDFHPERLGPAGADAVARAAGHQDAAVAAVGVQAWAWSS